LRDPSQSSTDFDPGVRYPGHLIGILRSCKRDPRGRYIDLSAPMIKEGAEGR